MKVVCLLFLAVTLFGCTKHSNDISTSKDSTAFNSAKPDSIQQSPLPAPFGSDSVIIIAQPERVAPSVKNNSSTPATPAPDKSPAQSGNIRVSSPTPGATVNADQFQLRGQARTFENMVSYRLTSGGKVLAQGHVQAKGPMGVFSSFQTMVKAGHSGKATLEVFQNSAKDGSEVDMVIVPIVLSVGKG